MKNKLLLSLVLFFLAFGKMAGAEEGPRRLPELMVFYSDSCHRCQEAKSKVLPEIEEEFLGRISFEYYNVADIDSYRLLLALKEKTGFSGELDIPLFYINGKLIAYDGELKEKLRQAIIDSLGSRRQKRPKASADLLRSFKSFTPLAVTAAGLEDGINPCAFTVIVFFISFLSLQGYRKKELFLIGFSFIFAVFLTYLLIGLGIFNFLYKMRNFWIFTRVVNTSVGLLSIGLAALSLYDYFKFRRTGESEGLLLQLPPQVKQRIQAVIGLFYRRNKSGRESLSQPRIPALIASAVITGFLVSLLEAVCTGQVYVPTLAFVFKTTAFKLQAFLYILLYNVMFIVPLLIILFLALGGLTSADFARFMKRHLGLIKIIMSILFSTLGVLLLWRS